MPIISPNSKYRSGKGRRLTSADDDDFSMAADSRLRCVKRDMGRTALCSLVFGSLLSSVHDGYFRTDTKEGKIAKIELQ